MKKVLIALGGFAVLSLILVAWFIQTGNRLVNLDEQVNEKKAQVENVYQRRLDLIPNLVNTVKGYAKHEADVLEEVTRARAQAGQVKIEKPEDLPKFDQAQSQLSGALSRLLIVAERYPEMKANRNFLELQSQLEGTENRITIERQRFNQAAREYNTYLRSFPQSLVAAMRGFNSRPYFEAQPGAASAPKVGF
jgi:LemA protein